MTDQRTHHTIEHGMFMRRLDPAGDDPSARVLLWLHGLGESGLCFERIIHHQDLAGARHVVPDLPGYGRSPWPAAPLTLPDMADFLARWLRDTGTRAPVVVGHSMGGVLGQLLVERHPGAARALVDVDGNVSEGDCGFSKRVTGHSLAAFETKRYGKLCNAIYEQGIDDRPLRGYYASLRLADPRAFYVNAQELVELSVPETLGERLAALPLPTVYIAGFPRGAAPRSLTLLRKAGVPLELVEPAGHWPFLDLPDAFAAAVTRFLDGLD